MSKLQRRIYSALLRLHPEAFRLQFGRDMVRDCEDAIRDRGFLVLIGDAFLSLARQWKSRALAGPEPELETAAGHPFLAGRYVIVTHGSSFTAFDFACASIISLLLLLTIGYAASVPNRRGLADLQTVIANHDGGLNTPDNAPPHTDANTAVHREAPGDGGVLTAGTGTPHYKGVVRLSRAVAPPVWRQHASGGPRATEPLLNAFCQLALISIIVWVTSLLLRRNPSAGRKVAVAALGLLCLAASVAFGQSPASPTQVERPQTTASLPSFEVATIKPNDPSVPFFITPPGSQQILHTAGRARVLVAVAFGVPATADRVEGGPDWIDKDIYRIEGKIPDDVFARMQTMRAEERKAQALLMMRSLLADRFKLKMHGETREAPVYELVVAKSGTKLPPPNVPPAAGADGGKAVAAQMAGGMAMSKTQVRVRNMTLDGMLQAPWFGLGGRPVVNKTGLTGTYNLTLNWGPEPTAPAGSNGAVSPDDAGGESIFTALEEQLGLKLVPSKGPVEIVVIDHIEKPSEN